jgi:hypothetical protein
MDQVMGGGRIADADGSAKKPPHPGAFGARVRGLLLRALNFENRIKLIARA